MSALEDAGFTAADQADIERARSVVDEVNARLAAKGCPLAFSVTCHTPVRWAEPASAEFREGG